MTLLEDLYYGNISPWSDYTPSKETKKAEQKYNRCTDELRFYVSEKHSKEKLEELIESQSSLLALNEKDAFLNGFKLGVKLMIAIQGSA